MNKSLLLFTIGPVQSFIAQARKTQDLYCGSFLLSHLCRIAMQKAQKDYQADIIFPYPQNKSLPNRFLAEIPFTAKEKLQEMGAELEGIVRLALREMAQTIGKKLLPEIPKEFYAQIDDCLQIYWVAQEYNQLSYAELYSQLESWLGSVKNIKQFSQYPPNQQGRKCDVTGEQLALFYKPPKPAHLALQALNLANISPKYLSPGEALGGISFLKRGAEKYFTAEHNFNSNFPSSAKITLLNTLKKLDKICPQLLQQYQNLFSNFEEQLFYRENLTANYFAKHGYEQDKLTKAQALLADIETIARKHKIKFNKYYAIIMLDGDNMGEWLKGSQLNESDSIQNFHRALSKKLGSYADKVAKSIQNHQGKIVYCGGDDVLALVNLHHLLPILQSLRENFPNFNKIISHSKQSSTASCGICLAHYKTPLRTVLQGARQAEESAKNVTGKDALCFRVIKHSGEINSFTMKWKIGQEDSCVFLQQLLQDLAKENLSAGFSKKIAQEYALLPTKVETEMFSASLLRILKRSSKSEKIAKDWTGRFTNLFVSNENNLSNTNAIFHITTFLAREVN